MHAMTPEHPLDRKRKILRITARVLFAGFVVLFRDAYRDWLVILAGALSCSAFMLFLGGIDDLDAAAIFGLPFAVPGLILIFNRSDRH